VERTKSHIIPFILRVQEHGGEPIIPFSGVLERNLADMPEDEAAKYCQENNVQRYVFTDEEKMTAKVLCKCLAI